MFISQYSTYVKWGLIKFDLHKTYPEEATRGVLWKKVFLEILQNSQENTCARVSSQVFSCEFCKISKNTFSYRTPVAASVILFLVTENPLKMIKVVFISTLKTFFVLKMFKVVAWLESWLWIQNWWRR